MALRKLALMHQQFGVCYGHSCGECSNLVSGRYRGRILRKCEVYGLTHSEASDWAKRWVACGMLNGIYTGRPIIELVRGKKQGVNYSKASECANGKRKTTGGKTVCFV